MSIHDSIRDAVDKAYARLGGDVKVGVVISRLDLASISPGNDAISLGGIVVISSDTIPLGKVWVMIAPEEFDKPFEMKGYGTLTTNDPFVTNPKWNQSRERSLEEICEAMRKRREEGGVVKISGYETIMDLVLWQQDRIEALEAHAKLVEYLFGRDMQEGVARQWSKIGPDAK